MKMYITVVLAGLFILLNFDARAQSRGGGNETLIIIDGQPATEQELQALSDSSHFEIQYLSPQKAQAIYGPAGAKGALLLTKSKPSGQNKAGPLVVLNGKPVPADSLEHIPFQKIDVLRGRQAINLYGPAAKDGVFMVEAAPEKAHFWLEIVNKKGKPVKGAQLLDEEGNVLAISNKCGMALLENFPVGSNVTIKSKRYQPLQLGISDRKQKIILSK
ncbi:TonB-dependent receptor family protein [Flammeovirgaceae bacterium 311]|nr:TonB-dependent receptor family protein [Flammeovirgaceae bacterium 311]